MPVRKEKKYIGYILDILQKIGEKELRDTYMMPSELEKKKYHDGTHPRFWQSLFCWAQLGILIWI